jgi:hypothetical protein
MIADDEVLHYALLCMMHEKGWWILGILNGA